MPSDKEIFQSITEASQNTADPKRAETNLLRLLEAAPEKELFLPHLTDIAQLFSVSQFLANYCFSYPDELSGALRQIREPVTKKFLFEQGRESLSFPEEFAYQEIIKTIRLFKKQHLLRITLRDVTGMTDILASMDEITSLAEVIIHFALQAALQMNRQKFGNLSSEEGLSLIALGKLGGEELNYSSDMDLMAVYENEEGQTSGIMSPSGVKMNRISGSEFYFKVIELFNRMLSANTEDGIAYRVDLRLRPQGEKGEIALPLKAYSAYYETWGRTWERMALIRARHIAGSPDTGRAFMEVIAPFVWKQAMDFTEIEEIKSLKKKIDSAFSKNDIKRGYGGIREAEFFIQTFQLIYGSKHEGLRTHRLLNAIQSLRWLGLVPDEDLVTLWDNYLHLRRIEHLLQMKDDLQTHSLPSSADDLISLARKIGFISSDEFLSDLRLRRMKTRNMYNSLLGTEEDAHAEALSLLEGDLSDDELAGYLSFRGLKTPSGGLKNLRGIREQFEHFKTQRERTVMRKAVPMLIENALDAESPDRALSGLERFFTATGIRETYLTGLIERKELRDGIIKIFSMSTYLSRIFLSTPQYLDLLIEGNVIQKTSKQTMEELKRITAREHFETGIAVYKNAEEIRLGSFFLMRVITVNNLVRYLSHLADAVTRIITERSLTTAAPLMPPMPRGKLRGAGFSVLGLGKLGGREITFGSDLDIIFLSETPDDLKTAEKILKTLTAYTDKGVLYTVDMRLRPEGSKGVLLNDIAGYKNYYLKNAHPWEIQALLKARPIAGDMNYAKAFMETAKEAVLKRGREIKTEYLKAMRERIVKELSHESKGLDIKLGPGGIEEIEFFIQRLQLQNAWNSPEILLQNTPLAIKRLMKKNLLGLQNGKILLSAYEYLRTLETFMRLNEEHVIIKNSEFAELAALFMGHKSKDEFMEYVRGLRKRITGIISNSKIQMSK
ncbi:MAG: bifunctional [glutamate--ammonia ligase]-adenylyl-L-tyrosine phosphorylase/[glutamate--ammonia-ligase] adenylyltransferase [Nitrospirae bacterium]|nr:bifunctional [glutamate--ammonia ligase]-adenylyl-L-tyrosine phosphorylase/[glutamate--ammonia-ligase] adenylyltransferase [Nitrospirota bacterium]